MKVLLRYAVSLGLMAAFLYWAFRGIDAQALWSAVRSVSAGWLAAIVATTLVTVALRGWRWVVLLRPVAPTVTILDAILALAICYSANVAFPRSGEAARALSLKWRRGASVSAVLGTVVVERVMDLLWLALFLAIAVAIAPGRIGTAFPWQTSMLGFEFSLSLAQVSICVLLMSALLIGGMVGVYVFGDRGIAIVESIVGRLSGRLAERVASVLDKFVHGLVALRSRSAYVQVVLSSALLNGGYILIIYESFLAFGFDDMPLSLGLAPALVIMAVSSIGVVVPTPAGAGSYHFFYGQSLHVLFAVPVAAAMACATAVHAVANITYVVVGVPTLLAQRRHRRRDEDTSLADEMATLRQESVT